MERLRELVRDGTARYPWFVALVAFCLGYHLPLLSTELTPHVLTLAAAVALSVLGPRGRAVGVFAVAWAWVTVGQLRHAHLERRCRVALAYPPEGQLLIHAEATVAEGPVLFRRSSVVVESHLPIWRYRLEGLTLLRRGDECPTGAGVTFFVPAEIPPVKAGDRIRFKARLAPLRHDANPGQPCHGCRALRNGQIGTVWCPTPELIERLPGISWRYLPARLAAIAEERLRRRLSPAAAALTTALVTGQTQQLPPDIHRAFREAGLLHLLAVSGLHLGLVAGIAWLPARLIGLSPRWAAGVGVIVAGLFAVQAGLRLPTLRALIMLAVHAAALWVRRPVDRVNTLSLAALVVLVCYPDDWRSLGFCLSFGAVAAFYWIVPPVWDFVLHVTDWNNPLRLLGRGWLYRLAWHTGLHVGHSLVASLVVTTLSLPFLAWHGLPLPWIGALMTPLLVVVVGLLIALGSTVAWATPIADAVDELLETVASWTLDLVVLADSLARPCLPTPGTTWIVVAAALVLVSRALAGQIRVWIVGGALLLVVLAPRDMGGNGKADGGLAVTVLNVRHGLCVLVTYRHHGFVYDAGSLDGGQRVAWALWRAMRHFGVYRLDFAVASHADVDHVNGMVEVLRTVPIERLYVSPGLYRSRQRIARELRRAARRAGVPLRVLSTATALRWQPSVRLRVLHPPPGILYSTDNQESVVLSVAYAGRHLLLPGDVEAWGLADLLAGDPGPVDVLVSPHHGSRRANPSELFRVLNPRVLIVSAEHRWEQPRRWLWGHVPHRYVTGRDGAVTVFVEPTGQLRVVSWRHGERED